MAFEPPTALTPSLARCDMNTEQKADMTDLAPGATQSFRWDLTINVPTVMTLLVAALSSALWIGTLYRGLDTRTTANETENKALRKDLERAEAISVELRRDRIQQLDSMRAEFRGALRDVDQKLDALLLQGKAR